MIREALKRKKEIWNNIEIGEEEKIDFSNYLLIELVIRKIEEGGVHIMLMIVLQINLFIVRLDLKHPGDKKTV